MTAPVTPTPATSTDVRRAAMDLLARREHSNRELHDKLAQRFSDSALIRQALDQLTSEGLQNDARFAEAYVHSRAQRLYGPLRIRQELRERGLCDSVVEAALHSAEVDWAANLKKLTSGKFGLKPAKDFKERAQRMRFLQYRGFAADQIRRLVGDPGESGD